MKSIHMQDEKTNNNTNDGFLSKFLNSPKSWTILACGWAFYLYEYLLRVSPKVMMEPLSAHFELSGAAFGFLASLYYWSYVPLQIPCGVIVDSWGPRKVVTASALLCAIGSFLFALPDSLPLAQVGRFLIGAGSACAYISCMKIASQWFLPMQFALIAGISQMMGTVGGISGDVPFASLVNTAGWQGAMSYAGFGALALAVLSWVIIRDRPSDVSYEPKPFKDHIKSDLKDILMNKQILLVGLYGSATFLTLTAFADLWGVPYLMQRFDITNTQASVGTTAIYIGFAIGSLLTSFVSTYFKSRVKVMSISAVGSVIGFGTIFFLPDVPLNMIYALMLITGIFAGFQILYFTVAVESSAPESTATAVGFTNALVMLSGLVFQPLMGGILDMFWDGSLKSDGVRLYSEHAYQYALSTLLLASIVALIMTRFIKETYDDKAL